MLNLWRATYIRGGKTEVVVTQILAANFEVDMDLKGGIRPQEEERLEDSFRDIEGYRIGGKEVGVERGKIVDRCEVGPGQKVKLGVGPWTSLVLQGRADEPT